ncbi:hypothetical protein HERIO_119 [Hepatospora eriocheir]|uniref:Uncharacterized protein n=1 Tax=Hepatospora eriocheir TaxID=1081669 RepID=A0A1X0QE26_9MICR|nr:hypothetical protein HERIO_119 [Hepatospora eriocheir]
MNSGSKQIYKNHFKENQTEEKRSCYSCLIIVILLASLIILSFLLIYGLLYFFEDSEFIGLNDEEITNFKGWCFLTIVDVSVFVYCIYRCFTSKKINKDDYSNGAI